MDVKDISRELYWRLATTQGLEEARWLPLWVVLPTSDEP
jgi:hypothetical protein